MTLWSRITLRDITDLAGCEAVVDVQHEVWGEVFELVPAALLLVSVKRGGVLVGAFGGEALVGFVWSMPGWRDGRPTHWSHMLGVLEPARGGGVGLALKQAQRDRVLASGVDLIEWTFDPLVATSAHLNIAKLGCAASTYLRNAYGALEGPLHRGTPTDRLVAEWWIGATRVPRTPKSLQGSPRRSLIETRTVGVRSEVVQVCPELHGAIVTIPVPAAFAAMQQEATALALDWRMATREAFSACFAAGYEVVGFEMDREHGDGQYVLAIPAAS